MPTENRRRALVTGASRGIGRAVAIELARSGFDVAIHYKEREDAARETLREVEALGAKGTLLAFDVADRGAAEAALETDLRERGAFWGVVCNAGVTSDGPFAGMSAESWDRVLRTNLDSFYNVVHPLLMPMVQLRSGGRIVVMSSISGVAGNRGQVNYSASKAGLIGAARSLALELAKRGITVNCVAPGLIDTEMLAGLDREEILAQVPMRRLGTSDEVASAVGYLFSERAAYVTGQVLRVDGGM
jgi:3-oxoacyl-[acyl-carrier protein] reductase